MTNKKKIQVIIEVDPDQETIIKPFGPGLSQQVEPTVKGGITGSGTASASGGSNPDVDADVDVDF